MDAWGITAVIVIAALFIHQQLNADGFILVALVTVTYWLGFALNDYFDEERTILITTHQVEEIENLLTDVMFINDGNILLDSTMDSLSDTYVEVMASGDNAQKARGLGPIAEHEMFGKSVMLFEGVSREHLEGLGEIRIPSVADLFVAKIKEARK